MINGNPPKESNKYCRDINTKDIKHMARIITNHIHNLNIIKFIIIRK